MSTDDTRPLADRLGLPDDRPTEVLTDEVTGAPGHPGDEATTAGPAVDRTPHPTGAPGHPVGAPAAGAPTAPAPVYRRGPAPFALLVAVLGLVVAGSVLLTELADVSVPWSTLGPWVVVGGGLLVVLVGLLGLRATRAQD